MLRSLLSAVRSTAFLVRHAAARPRRPPPCSRTRVPALRAAQSAFVSMYQAFVCSYRRFVRTDHRAWYWLAGLFAGTSLLIERKSRRAELALYALPRAGDSVWQILAARRLVLPLPHGELALFAAGAAAICYMYEHHRHAVAPFISKVMGYLLRPMPAAEGDAAVAAPHEPSAGASGPALSSIVAQPDTRPADQAPAGQVERSPSSDSGIWSPREF